jgi:hypothetical protein
MNVNYIRASLLVTALVFACKEDEPMGTATTNTSKTSDATEGQTNTSDGTDGTTSGNPTTGQVGTSGDMTTGGMMGSTGSFIMPKDGGTGGTKECDQWNQDCPDGEKCMPYSGDGDNAWESLKCTPVMENANGVGEGCTVEGSGVSGIDSCEKGAMCWNVDPETGMGVCVSMCIGTPDQPECADSETSCFNSNDGVLTLCLAKCDPLLQDCEGDDLCIYNPQDSSAFVCVLDASGEEGQEFDVCEYINACDKGFFCANPALAKECDPMSGGCCLAWCDLSVMPAECKGEGQSCLPWFEDGQAPPGLEQVGVCGIPQ